MQEQKRPDERRRRGGRRFWSRLAPRYDDWIRSSFEDQYRVFRSKISQHVEPVDKVLEIGTGTGNIALHIAPRVSRVVGVDISSEMISVAEGKLTAAGASNIAFQVADAYDLPFADGAFDKVVSVNALQTMKEPQRAVDEGMRVMRDGGEFLSITYCFGTSGLFEVLKLARWVFRFGFPRYWTNFKCTRVRQLFADAGFEVLDCTRLWRAPAVVFVHARKVADRARSSPEGTADPTSTDEGKG